MDDQKMDNLLNLAFDSSQEEREKSFDLNVGYDPRTNLWDVIVKYSGELEEILEEGMSAVPLLNQYAVMTMTQEKIQRLAQKERVEYIEKPKRLFFAVFEALQASCIRSLQLPPAGLSGKGVLVGMVDSGVDYRHPDFRKEDGSTRILSLWDQTVRGTPPRGYQMGAEFTREQIDQALLSSSEGEGYELVPSRDLSGHGTQVLGIAAGNGRASQGLNRGVAWESDLMVVKLGAPRENSFPRTTELIQGIDYLIRQSLERNQPMALNLSFGNNYGSHQGDSLLETYLDSVATMGRNSICVGTGNEGSRFVHTSETVKNGEVKEVQLSISSYESVMNIQLWKAYVDELEIYLIAPSGETAGPFYERLGPQRFLLGNTDILVYYGKPSPFQLTQEIYMDFIPRDMYIDQGIWRIRLRGRQVVRGTVNLWLPGGGALNENTGFYFSSPDITLTIPSTARKVIAVGAYDSAQDTYAEFSGRGYLGADQFVKPDLAAPGVGITAPSPGGGYREVTGTSFAAPFVTGSAALMMQWGILQGRDPYLYGEKLRAYLRRGARQIRGLESWPNAQMGYGALCLADSLPQGLV